MSIRLFNAFASGANLAIAGDQIIRGEALLAAISAALFVLCGMAAVLPSPADMSQKTGKAT